MIYWAWEGPQKDLYIFYSGQFLKELLLDESKRVVWWMKYFFINWFKLTAVSQTLYLYAMSLSKKPTF